MNNESPFSRGQVSNKEFRIMKFSYPSTFIIPCSIFDIGLHVKNIKNNLALMEELTLNQFHHKFFFDFS